jgi:hypothetical protein
MRDDRGAATLDDPSAEVVIFSSVRFVTHVSEPDGFARAARQLHARSTPTNASAEAGRK